MSKLYNVVFSEFQKELKQCSAEIFLYPLPFTQVNRLAMLAATVAERCAAQQGAAPHGAFCSCKVFVPDPRYTAIVCKHCGRPSA